MAFRTSFCVQFLSYSIYTHIWRTLISASTWQCFNSGFIGCSGAVVIDVKLKFKDALCTVVMLLFYTVQKSNCDKICSTLQKSLSCIISRHLVVCHFRSSHRPDLLVRRVIVDSEKLKSRRLLQSLVAEWVSGQLVQKHEVGATYKPHGGQIRLFFVRREAV